VELRPALKHTSCDLPAYRNYHIHYHHGEGIDNERSGSGNDGLLCDGEGSDHRSRLLHDGGLMSCFCWSLE